MCSIWGVISNFFIYELLCKTASSCDMGVKFVQKYICKVYPPPKPAHFGQISSPTLPPNPLILDRSVLPLYPQTRSFWTDQFSHSTPKPAHFGQISSPTLPPNPLILDRSVLPLYPQTRSFWTDQFSHPTPKPHREDGQKPSLPPNPTERTDRSPPSSTLILFSFLHTREWRYFVVVNP